MAQHGDAAWSNPRVLSTLAIVFIFGVAFGCVCMRGYLRSHLLPTTVATPIDQARHVGLENLKAKLKLSSSQEQTITKILDDYGKYYQNIEDERQDVAHDGSRRILEALTPEQRKIFNETIGQRPGHSN
ncbi:MAG: hypothetical protein M3Y24_02075 [Acidobacteriota bacterium]|nr:hypothetical protein [Acidobacteriota bacterium]